ncbi:MAG: histidine phosphatase family protein [Ktedonobacteraceae bacterium]
MRLLLIRHWSTLDNEQQRYSGQADVPLSPPGESQVALLGQQLAHEPIDIIVTSDLQRARATGAAIAHYHQAQVYEDPAIREISLGAWEGLTFAELRERDPEAYYGWQNKPLDVRPPGGETIVQLRDRVVRALEFWYTGHVEDTVVWTTHGGVIRVLLCHLLNTDLNSWGQYKREYASVTDIRLGQTAGGSIVLVEGPHNSLLNM